MAWLPGFLLFLAAAPLSAALEFAGAHGQYLVTTETKRMITMNGVWYGLSNSTTDVSAMDSLTDPEACTRDAALMTQLGINTIYVDTIDPEKNHDDCFSIFNSVGIYVVLLLRLNGIFGSDVDVKGTYRAETMKEIFTLVDAVRDYENLMALEFTTVSPRAYLEKLDDYALGQKTMRSMIRDVKEYLSKHGRPIMIGVNSNAGYDLEEDVTADYLEHATCYITTEQPPISNADYVSFDALYFIDDDAVSWQNQTFTHLDEQLENATVPTWIMRYATATQKNGSNDYEVTRETLGETELLYNTSREFLLPEGKLAGGSRFTWTNTAIGQPIANWGITMIDGDGNVQLVDIFDRLKEIFGFYNTDGWKAGTPMVWEKTKEKKGCKKELIQRPTRILESSGQNYSLPMATDWDLPSRPSEVEAMVTSGVSGTRGQMVDVTITTIGKTIKDSGGNVVTGLALKPSKSEARSTTSRQGASNTGSGAPNSTTVSALTPGAKAGIGAGAAIGGLALLGLAGFMLLRRRRNKKAMALAKEHDAEVSDSTVGGPTVDGGATTFAKAELATGPDVEVNQAELPAGQMAKPSIEMPAEKSPQEVPEAEAKAEYPGMNARMNAAPVELPAFERPVELEGQGNTNARNDGVVRN